MKRSFYIYNFFFILYAYSYHFEREKNFSRTIRNRHTNRKTHHIILNTNEMLRFFHNDNLDTTNSKDTLIKLMNNDSNFYNLKYYDCSKYPDDKNFSKSGSSLFMVSSKFTRNVLKEQEVSFNVSNEVILLPEQKYQTDINRLMSDEFINTLKNGEKSNSFLHYSIHEVISTSLMSDLMDISFVFYDETSVTDIIDIIESWKFVIQGYNVIILSNKLANTDNKIIIPKWIEKYEIYKSSDVEKVTNPSKFDLRLYAYWISKKKYLFMIGDKRCPYSSENKSKLEKIVPLLGFSLLANTIPYEHHSNEIIETIAVIPMFSSLYFNSFKNKSDHEIDDNQNISLILPNKIRFDLPLNQPIAFNRELIGPLLTFFIPPKLQSKNNKQRLICNKNLSLSCEDVITGWILQILTEIKPFNIKVVSPLVDVVDDKMNSKEWILENNFEYSICNSTYSSNNYLPEWYCDAKRFFTTYKFSRCRKFYVNRWYTRRYCRYSQYGDLPNECLYISFVDAMKNELGHYSYFNDILEQMYRWVVMENSVWELRMAYLGNSYPVSSRNHITDKSNRELKCSVLTIACNEKALLPKWTNYYLKHFDPRDIFILDHLTTDNSIQSIKSMHPNINFVKLEGSKYSMPLGYRSSTVELYQDMLLRLGYKCVLFGDVDEIIVPNPKVYLNGLSQYLDEFIKQNLTNVMKVSAYEIAHIAYGNGTKGTEEQPLDWNKSILTQRNYYFPDKMYNKPLLTKIPLKYRPGFHKLFDFQLSKTIPLDSNLVMFHLRSIDYKYCHERAVEKFNMSLKMNPSEKAAGYADHWIQYELSNRVGTLCQFANGCYLGPIKEVTHWDNTGVYPLNKLEEYWNSVFI